jgi:hypothetical protein
VVLLWWPAFFPAQSATSWLGRGVVWTLVLELLLIALSPFELALWNTNCGARLSQRFEAKRALLDDPSAKGRMGRRAVLAVAALTVPLAVIAVGVGRHIPDGGTPPPAPRVTKVTRVVRVVKPVRVERVVKIKTVSQQVPAEAVSEAPVSVNRAPTAARKRSTQKHSSGNTTTPPKAHAKVPTTTGETTPQSDGSTTPSTQTPATAPSTTETPSGATASPSS